jgi:DNA cross-link repair 1A protein
MNSSAACHQVEGLPGLYIDAFKGAFLRKTSNASNTFVLTHYHGDHYQSLPRDGKYQGNACIHCTPVTAALLRHVHKVPSQFVVEHEYGIPWTCKLSPSTTKPQASITFYDANHCPGAAVVAIQLPNGTVHLHSGDMRYHPRMKAYPVIHEAVRNQKLDLLYLDTTYGHPKHTFAPQEEAVEAIASQVHKVLSDHGQCAEVAAQQSRNDPSQPKVLILLSCYSIGKERVLWETSNRAHQPVYVTEKKFAMLSCIQSGKEQSSSTVDNDADQPHQMIQRCTRDPDATDLHVIPMGLAGELWPFFKPNYRKCVDYEEELQHNYDKIIAFIPTGWAEGSNWNKKNANSKRQLECRKSKRLVDVEIRLIAYSEHSSFSELVSFVQYCHPRKVVPTVFGDDNDRRRLEQVFRPYVDSSRAKLQFFRDMQASSHRSTMEEANQQSVDGVSDMEVPTIKRTPESAQPYIKQIPQVGGKAVVTSRSNADGKFVDLTCIGSDEEADSPSSKVISSPNKNDSTTTSVPTKGRGEQLAETRAYQSSKNKKVSPTKRKRGKGDKMKPSTPPITQFFAKRSR